jgi:hypothetical protein
MLRRGSKSIGPIRVAGKPDVGAEIVNAGMGKLAAHHRIMLEEESGIAP